MAGEGRGIKILKTIPVILGVLLVALYLLSAFDIIGFFGLEEVGVIFFIVQIVIIMTAAVFLLRRSIAREALDLTTITMVLIVVGFIYLWIKFPALVPIDYSNAVLEIQNVAEKVPGVQSIIDFNPLK